MTILRFSKGFRRNSCFGVKRLNLENPILLYGGVLLISVEMENGSSLLFS
jgi:hypothetical protein